MTTAATNNSISELRELATQLTNMNQLFFANSTVGALGYRDSSITIDTFFNASTNINKIFKNHDAGDEFFNVESAILARAVNVKMANRTAYDSSIAMSQWSDTTVNSVTTPGLLSKLASDSNPLVDINLYSLATNNSCKTFMNALYAWHHLCNDDKWDTYITTGTVDLKKAELDTTNYTNKTETITKGGSVAEGFKKDMNDVLEFAKIERATEIDRFMVQRVLYVYIRLLQYQLSMRYVDLSLKVTDTNILDATQKKFAWALPATIIGLLERDTTKLVDVIKKVDDRIKEKKKEYGGMNTEINDLHDVIDDQKTKIKNQTDRVGTEVKYESRGKSMMIASLVILLVVVIGAIVVLVAPFDKQRRLLGAAAVLGVASISAIILSVVFSKVIIEGFASSSPFVSPTGVSTLVDTITFGEGNILFSGEIRRKVLEYLQHCAMLVNSVKSYQILGNINYTMAKENRYFNDMNSQMTIANERIRGTHRSSDLVQKQYSASMYLFVTLSIIVGATLLSLVAFDGVAIVRTITFIVAGFFTVLALIIFVFEHSSYVRTDGDKKYWSQPPNTGVMMSP